MFIAVKVKVYWQSRREYQVFSIKYKEKSTKYGVQSIKTNNLHLIDYLPQVGGQLSEIYPKKPIYDIPGYPTILAQELVDNLMKQAEPFNPVFTFGLTQFAQREAVAFADGCTIYMTSERLKKVLGGNLSKIDICRYLKMKTKF